ncbi:hypothetical protein J4216_04485 [Candidatus Woesearchaeota archaeon]|nr:hypothetical protein [Candidatus Woesearchaeota archaeon]
MRKGVIVVLFILSINILLTSCTDQEFTEALCHDTSEDSAFVKIWCKMQNNSPNSQNDEEEKDYGCIDYDGGLDYYRASYTISGRDAYRSDDYCNDATLIIESYCGSDNGKIYYRTTSFTCPNGCELGACRNNT